MDAIASTGHHFHLSQKRPFAVRQDAPNSAFCFEAGLERSTEGPGHAVRERNRRGKGGDAALIL